jgi:hypothetical protein
MADQWEFCEIVVLTAERPGPQRMFATQDAWLAAKVIGPKGTHRAQTSDVKLAYEPREGLVHGEEATGEDVLACDALVQALLAEGWEPLGKGANWYSYLFRRRAEVAKVSRASRSGNTRARATANAVAK